MRYRAKLVAIRSGLKAQIHAVLAKAGVLIAASDLFGVTGRQRLAKVPLGAAYAQRIGSLLELIDILDSHEAANMSIVELPIDAADAILAGRLHWAHKDPFDRVIVAQALRRNLTIATRDSKILDAALTPVLQA